jgi:cytochrome b pre-mRNA-processing protein 3
MFRHLFEGSRGRRAAEALYGSAVAQARLVDFYGESGVPDTVDGRFDMIVLHVFLVLHRLKEGDAKTADTAQALFDAMFADMDRGLREMGAGDLGVGRRVKVMAKAFYGRVAAYERGLAEGGDALAAAVLRNIFRGDPAKDAAASRLASYMYGQVTALERQPFDALLEGRVVFAEPMSV